MIHHRSIKFPIIKGDVTIIRQKQVYQRETIWQNFDVECLRAFVVEFVAQDVAREILEKCHGSLERLHYELLPTTEQRDALRGIGPAKGCTIRAALELGRRLQKEREQNEKRDLVRSIGEPRGCL